MRDLSTQLAELITTDNAILFVGAELHLPASGLPPIQQIAEALAEKIAYEEADRSLAAVAQEYEIEFGRRGLIQALKDELRKFQGKPDEVHQLIAMTALSHTKILTTRFDQMLERALDEVDKHYIPIIQDTDVSFFDETKITLIKMQGDISQPNSLVITDDDLDAFISRLPAISDVVRAFFATKTLIFLGYDLDSPQFKTFYGQITRNLSAYRRKAYAIVATPMRDRKLKYWDAQNVEVHQRDPLTFLETLADAVREQAEVKRPPDPTTNVLSRSEFSLPESPYKALDSYEFRDAAIFSGRQEESRRLANRILAHRLTVLYGESGSGKSSLLLAGAGPRLARQRSLLAHTEPAPHQPLRERIRKAVLAIGDQAGLPLPDEDGLFNLLRTWSQAISGPIVIAIDQFEQFFNVYTEDEQQAAAAFLNDLRKDRSIDLRIVLVVREDFLGRLQSLDLAIPGLLDVRYRLERLGHESARAAIEEPARIFGIRWDESLVEHLLDDLYTADKGGISPPQLQIVCDRLAREVLEAGKTPNSSELHISFAQFVELGNTSGILGDYLENVIKDFNEDEQRTARFLLGTLVSASGIKLRLDLPTLARAAALPTEDAQTLLDALTNKRLLQRYETTQATQTQFEYELTHDYLVDRITIWLGKDFWDAQKARELLREHLPLFVDLGRLLVIEDVELLLGQMDFVAFSEEETAMVFASAVGAGIDPGMAAGTLSDKSRRDTLVGLLDNPSVDVRRRGAEALTPLAGFDRAPSALLDTAQHDPADIVRAAAAVALAAPLRSPMEYASGYLESLKTLFAAAENASHPDHDAARATLVRMRDQRPELSNLLPASLQTPVRNRVWRLRWNRYRNEILAATSQGLTNGFWGLGLGMGTFLGLFRLRGVGIFFTALLSLLFTGITLIGIIGAITAGSVAFVRATLQRLNDTVNPWTAWMIYTLLGGVMMSIGFVLFGTGVLGTAFFVTWVIIGAANGAALTGAATIPLPWTWKTRLAFSMAVGALAFTLIGLTVFVIEISLPLLLLIGATSGAGFFFALNPRFWRDTTTTEG